MTAEYQKLVEQVREVDEKAAVYLETEAKKLPSFTDSLILGMGLGGIFVWFESVQGHEYWENIYQKLQ